MRMGMGTRGGASGAKGRGRGKLIAKKKDKFLLNKKKACRFCRNKVKMIDYKDIKTLESLTSEKGKVFSGRGSGNCARHQRVLVEAVKRARFLSILPYAR